MPLPGSTSELPLLNSWIYPKSLFMGTTSSSGLTVGEVVPTPWNQKMHFKLHKGTFHTDPVSIFQAGIATSLESQP